MKREAFIVPSDVCYVAKGLRRKGSSWGVPAGEWRARKRTFVRLPVE